MPFVNNYPRFVKALAIICAIGSLALGHAMFPAVQALQPRSATAVPPPLDISLLPPIDPDQFNGVIAIRLSDIFANPEMAKTADEINQFLAENREQAAKLLGTAWSIPFKVQDIEQITAYFRFDINDPALLNSFAIYLSAVRMKKPCDWVALAKKHNPDLKVVKREGTTYFQTEAHLPKEEKPRTMFYPIVDERTIVLLGRGSVDEWIEARKDVQNPVWAAEWKQVEGSSLAAVIRNPRAKHAEKFANYVFPATIDDAEWKAHVALQVRFLRTMSRAVVGIDVVKSLRLNVRLSCDTAEDAVEMEKACASIQANLRKTVDALPDPAKTKSAEERFSIELKRAMLARLTVKRDDKQILLTAESKENWLKVLHALTFEPEDAVPPPLPPSPVQPAFPPPPPPSPVQPTVPPPPPPSPIQPK